jgi:hypothetical protein
MDLHNPLDIVTGRIGPCLASIYRGIDPKEFDRERKGRR